MYNVFSGLNLFQTAPANSTGSLISTVVMFGAVFAIFYFMIIRPQKKREKAAQAMIAAVKKGDKVVTIGGMHGVVSSVKEKTIIIKVDDSAKIEFSKSAISSVEPKGEEAKAEEPKAIPEEKKEASK